jgi:hypothetical protein
MIILMSYTVKVSHCHVWSSDRHQNPSYGHLNLTPPPHSPLSRPPPPFQTSNNGTVIHVLQDFGIKLSPQGLLNAT